MRFSDRIGITKPPLLDLQEMTSELKVALWNAWHPPMFSNAWQGRCASLWNSLHWPVDYIPYHDYDAKKKLRTWFFDDARDWHEIYDVSELCGQILAANNLFRVQLWTQLNDVLEVEGSPYRFLDGQLTPVADPVEYAALAEAATGPRGFAGAAAHIKAAAQMLGARPEPDFRNCIKEAISAVESALKIITGRDHADLADALRDFQQAHPIHGALFQGLDSLYGYTSNEHGLRHALLDGHARVGFNEAKFMLVACAAFVSFLVGKASEAT